MMIRHLLALGLGICLGLVQTIAHAQDRSPSRVFVDDWSQGRTRAFVAWGASAGSTSRADLTIGYGKPYWTYIAFESDGLTTRDMAMTRLRARLALIWADLSIGWGRAWAYDHTLLPKQERYHDLSLPDQEAARYRTLQLVLCGFIPAPGGYLDWQVEGLRVSGTRDGVAVYEEQLRAVMFPSWALVGRLGYSYQFASKRAAVGALAEGVWPGNRADYIARVGPVFSWAFSPSFDVAATLTTTVHSPDALGVYDDLWGNVRLRYRGATK